jgi:hypothetical protein
MSKIKLEAFLSSTSGPNDDNLLNLLKEIEPGYKDQVEIIVYNDYNELFDEYNLCALPALVVGELIKFIGFCPDKESIVAAIQESGIG